MNEFDVVIIGGGAAGLSAALVLSRARRRVAVVDAGRPRNAPAAHMHGFLGSDGLPPGELLAAGRKEVEGYGGVIIPGTVQAVSGAAPAFTVGLADGELRARRVLVTTGLTDVIPDLPGARERWGRDLLHCPYCHGYEVRDRPLGVLGGNPEAVAHALLIREWSADLVFFTHGTVLDEAQRERLRSRGVAVVDHAVTDLVVTGDELTGVRLDTGEVVPRAAVFVRPRFVANSGLLTGLGCATDGNGWVTVDGTGQTSVPGVFAAGNAVNPRATVITAAGEGSAAAIAVNTSLVEESL
ncbi:NAD(P)/FAD-dependent oxidoreductase [Dactylosporangium sp. CS-033363]|uniref:NAD(P)/FAD-dependent oxidoreductase n=1 Tax=Dactylosporangium sp. CS-033363 TaxID=3239935 RepID=UPI003D94F3D8